MKLSFTFTVTATAITTLFTISLAAPSSSSLSRRIVPGDSGEIFERQTTTSDGTCGNVNAGNNKGYKCSTETFRCCSKWGWCGDSNDHCGVGCQSAFGSCSGSPNPTTTNSGPVQTREGRAKVGSVPYGVQINSCSVPGTVALTFDDGPYIYTSELLDILAEYGAKATFFVNGQNWGSPITDESKTKLVRRMDSEGHQIGSHTWAHANLDALSIDGIKSQMTQLESALVGIIGKMPTYMRPPYFFCGSTCSQVMNELSYHVITMNVDTRDWANDSPDLIHNSEELFNGIVSSVPVNTGKWLVSAHDVHANTVKVLAKYMLDRIKTLGYKAVTVGDCLADPSGNWYRTA